MRRLICSCFVLVFALTVQPVSAQTIVSIAPDNGMQGENLPVTITGQNTDFTVSSGTSIPVWLSQGSSTINTYGWAYSPTSLHAYLNIPLTAPVGLWDVSVDDNVNPVMTLTNAFTVTVDTVVAISSINPKHAFQGEALWVSIVGRNTHFGQGSSTVVWFGQGSSTIYANSASISSPTLMDAHFDLPVSAPTGWWSLSVQEIGYPIQTLSNSFYVYSPDAHIVAINPDHGAQGEYLRVTITGQNTDFTVSSGTSFPVWLSQGSSTIYTSGWAYSPTSLYAYLSIPFSAPVGLWDVSVNDNVHPVMTLTNAFTVTVDTVVAISSINPKHAFQGDALWVSIVGRNTHFGQGSSTVVWFRQGSSTIYANSASISSPTLMDAHFDLPVSAPTGWWSLSVQEIGYPIQTLSNSFYVYSPDAHIVAINPDHGAQGEYLRVTITGQNTDFTVSSGTSIPVWLSQGSSTISTYGWAYSPTSLHAYLSLPLSAPVGLWDVSVNDNVHPVMTLTNGFTVGSSCGDIDGSGQTNLSDVVYLINFIFGGGAPPLDEAKGDIDCSGHTDVSDAVYLVAYVFGAGTAPCHGPLCAK